MMSMAQRTHSMVYFTFRQHLDLLIESELWAGGIFLHFIQPGSTAVFYNETGYIESCLKVMRTADGILLAVACFEHKTFIIFNRHYFVRRSKYK